MKNKNILEYFLIPLSWIYGIVIFFRNFLFNTQILQQREFNIPIISIGNITVGGTGKTPHVEYLISLLKNEYRIATLSRGYKRKTKGFMIAEITSTPEQIGDEPSQIKRKFPGIEVAVDSNRVNGIQKLMSSGKNINVIILDDAYQHRYVKPGLSLLLIDYSRPITEDSLLPFGRLREPASAKKRADIILVTKSPLNLKPIERRVFFKKLELLYFQNLYFTSVIREELKSVFPNYSSPAPEKFHELKPAILVIAGIANPHELKKFVLNFSTNITELYFPDHHDYSENDITQIQSIFSELPGKNKIIITTEKDSVRLLKFDTLPEEIKENMFFIPIKIIFQNDDELSFNNQILKYVRGNKRNSILHKGKNNS